MRFEFGFNMVYGAGFGLGIGSLVLESRTIKSIVY